MVVGRYIMECRRGANSAMPHGKISLHVKEAVRLYPGLDLSLSLRACQRANLRTFLFVPASAPAQRRRMHIQPVGLRRCSSNIGGEFSRVPISEPVVDRRGFTEAAIFGGRLPTFMVLCVLFSPDESFRPPLLPLGTIGPAFCSRGLVIPCHL